MQEISKQRLSPNIIAFYYLLIKNNDAVDCCNEEDMMRDYLLSNKRYLLRRLM